ncbi:hypothetical protein [Vibrio harveyi]|uniref:hypothetical protein n=1 Tax=Vibrio harveyi TaxID=669 RepID=UPI0039093D2D
MNDSVTAERQAYKVGELIRHGIQRSNLSDQDYHDLLREFEEDIDFKDRVMETARGMGLSVHDESGTDYGLLLSAHRNSPFSVSLGWYGKTLDLDTKRIHDNLAYRRASLVLIHVAIASTFFPTSDSLEDIEVLNEKAVTAYAVLDILKSLCSKLQENNNEFVEPAYVSAAEVLMHFPEAIPEKKKNTMASQIEMISAVMDHLFKQKLIFPVDKEAENPAYFPMPIYQVYLRSRSYHVMTLMNEILNSKADTDVAQEEV